MFKLTEPLHIALILSGVAIWQSQLARKDSQSIAGLRLKPELRVNAKFNKAKTNKFTIVVSNFGPIAAHQLKINLINHRYIKELNKISISGGGSETRFHIKQLLPFQKTTVEVSKHFLYSQALIQEPPEHNVIELKIKYRRAPDMKLFAESSFYFVNPDGVWVGEYNSSLIPEKTYKPVKRAALEMLNKDVLGDLSWNTLHPAFVEEND